jgi:hypothetical protein
VGNASKESYKARVLIQCFLTETEETAVESGGENERRLVGIHCCWAPVRCTVRCGLAAEAREDTLGATGLAVAPMVALTASSESMCGSWRVFLRSRKMLQIFS